jgi:small subunit ribosomal protein S13
MAENEQDTSAASEDEEAEDFRYIVRVENTDLDGHQPVVVALTGIKGIGERIAGVVTDHVDAPRTQKIGNLDEEEIDSIQETISSIDELLPGWMVNRRKDIRSGENHHLLHSNLDDKHREDLNRLKKIQSYRGVRHEQGKKVRGQRTKSNGRSGMAMGVEKAEIQASEDE